MHIALSRIFPFPSRWPLVNRNSLRADLLAGLADAEMLVQDAQRLRAMGGGLYFWKNKKEAIATIYAWLGQDKCARCSARIFYECNLGQSTPCTDQVQKAGMPA